MTTMQNTGAQSFLDIEDALPGEPAHRDKHTDVEVGNAVDVAEATFNLLVQGPESLAFDGAAFGYGLPARSIGLVELRAILLHPATGYATRDAVWAELVRRSREDGPAWVVGCLGVALPGLKAIIARSLVSAGGRSRHWHDQAVADLVVAFYDGLRTIDTTQPKIAQRLLRRAYKAAMANRAANPKVVPTDPRLIAGVGERAVTHGPDGHVNLVLAAAVRHGVISKLDASIIGTTRFEDVNAADVAAQLGLTYGALMKRRRRAELKLAEAMRDGGLRDDFGDLMSNSGL